MDTRDKKVLYLVQHMYGGSVKQISNAQAFKYKLRNRAGLIALINDVNGLIRNHTGGLYYKKDNKIRLIKKWSNYHLLALFNKMIIAKLWY
jgi:hypothetical protein